MIATVPGEVLSAVHEKPAKKLRELYALDRSEASEVKKVVTWSKTKPNEPLVIATAIFEKFAIETRVLMERLGARVELIPAADEETETGLGEASQSSAESEPPPEASGNEDVLAQIEKLGQLHDTGILTHEEFQAKKAELLSRLEAGAHGYAGKEGPVPGAEWRTSGARPRRNRRLAAVSRGCRPS